MMLEEFDRTSVCGQFGVLTYGRGEPLNTRNRRLTMYDRVGANPF